jgi:hypothetical protein
MNGIPASSFGNGAHTKAPDSGLKKFATHIVSCVPTALLALLAAMVYGDSGLTITYRALESDAWRLLLGK